jgi:hypothetical protein
MKEEKKLFVVFINHLVGGIGWVFGVTIGFALVGYIMSKAVGSLGGLPVVGEVIANVIVVTQNALIRNTK